MGNHHSFLKFGLIAGAMSLAGCVTSPTPSPETAELAQPSPVRAIKHVSGDVYRFQNDGHFSVFMVTDDGVIMTDPINFDAATWLKNEIAARFNKPITHILYSHAHHDHTAGAFAIDDAIVVSHEASLDYLDPPEDQALQGRHIGYDVNGDGVLQPPEMAGPLEAQFKLLDVNEDSLVTGLELFRYQYGNVKMPDVTYSEPVKTITLGGKTVEMHHVTSKHAGDMSFIHFPEEKVVFVVDVISLRVVPFGVLIEQGEEDLATTYAAALKHDADIIVPGHGVIGAAEHIEELRTYMATLKAGVLAGIEAGRTVEQMQAELTLDDYADWEFYQDRRDQNIASMYRYLTTQE